jgi:hypothetical protein
MAADFLELNHHVSQFFVFNLPPFTLMGDRPVLAEDASEITIGEKDGPGTIFAHQRYLFTEMRMSIENRGFDWRLAKSFFTLLPIHSAPPGTELTAIEEIIGLLDPLSQFSLLLQFLVSWMPFFLLLLFGTSKDWGEEQGAS